MHNKKKYLLTSMLAGSLILSVGCSSNDAESNQQVSQQSFSNNVDFMEDKNSIYGEIININEGNITLALGEFNMKGKGDKPFGEMPNGERPEMPSNTNGDKPEPPTDFNGEIPEFPNGFNGEIPEIPQGERPDGQQSPMNREPMEIISLNGEERVVTITSDIKISKMNMRRPNSEDKKEDSYTNEQLTLADLSVGDIIKVNYNEDNTKIKSLELISVPSMENNKENTDKEAKESLKEIEEVTKG